MLSQQTLIILVVTLGVVGLIVAVILFRLIIISCRTDQSAPVPPPQPLARHRAEAAEHRPSSLFPVSQHSFPANGRLDPPAPTFHSLTSAASFEDTTVESVGSDLTLNQPLDVLASPSPAFHMNSPRSSLHSSENDSPSDENHTPLTPRSQPHSPVPSRTPSLSSSHHTLRAVPHSPYSNMQVVLPAPLAHKASSNLRISVNNRTSVVDTWTSPLARTESPRNPILYSQGESPRASSSSLGSPSNPRVQRNASSSSSPSPSPSPSRAVSYGIDPNAAPPVPRIPSIYNTSYPPVDGQVDIDHLPSHHHPNTRNQS